jgi:hypothetical protein
MLNRSFQLSSTWKYFTEECERLKETFLRLGYPSGFLDAIFFAIWQREISNGGEWLYQKSRKRERVAIGDTIQKPEICSYREKATE